jgi:hypothetical protein
MPAVVFPRRTTSAAATLTILQTQLASEAGQTASNTFRAFGGAGLTTRVPHPTTGFSVNVLEDGSSNSGYPILGYTGKGCYDPTTRQVLMMGSGAGGQLAGHYFRNTVARFRETANSNLGLWDAPARAYRGIGDTANKNGMIHMYDSNCINVAGRRCYHKNGVYNEFFQYDIDNGTILENIAGPADLTDGTYWWSAAEVIPTRGTQGAMWVFSASNPGGSTVKLWEYDFGSQTWSTLFNNAAFGNSVHDINGPVISYNPRAFGGVGGCMLSNNGLVWTINCSTLALASASGPPTGVLTTQGAGAGFCRDPVGDGWLAIQRVARVVYRYTGGSWQTRAAWPTFNVDNGYIVIPIDAYGVVWMISWDSGPSGLLYRP